MKVEPRYDQELDSLLRQTLDIPPEKRTVLALVRHFNIGIYKAKRLDASLKEFAPDEGPPEVVRVKSLMGEDYHGGAPKMPAKAATPTTKAAKPPAKKGPLEGKRCGMHKGKAVMKHDCGEYLCAACTKDEELCPYCQEPLRKAAVLRPKPQPERQERPPKDETRDFSRL